MIVGQAGGHVCNRDYSSKFGAAGKAEKTRSDEVLIPISL